ncbi:MAG: hypothetical protein OXI30_20235, partial [Chloroflexota bacterium]|nr:hypothetical protein [Chloroflexota bacterium]
MKRSTVELEIALEIEEYVRVIAKGENCSIEAILQEGLALLFGNDSIVEYLLNRLSNCRPSRCMAAAHAKGFACF